MHVALNKTYTFCAYLCERELEDNVVTLQTYKWKGNRLWHCKIDDVKLNKTTKKYIKGLNVSNTNLTKILM